jgi:hypothetical protein
VCPSRRPIPRDFGWHVSCFGCVIIHADEDSIYWADASAGLVMKAARVGGRPRVLTSNQGELAQIAVDEDSVYWTTSDGALVRATPK